MSLCENKTMIGVQSRLKALIFATAIWSSLTYPINCADEQLTVNTFTESKPTGDFTDYVTEFAPPEVVSESVEELVEEASPETESEKEKISRETEGESDESKLTSSEKLPENTTESTKNIEKQRRLDAPASYNKAALPSNVATPFSILSKYPNDSSCATTSLFYVSKKMYWHSCGATLSTSATTTTTKATTTTTNTTTTATKTTTNSTTTTTTSPQPSPPPANPSLEVKASLRSVTQKDSDPKEPNETVSYIQEMNFGGTGIKKIKAPNPDVSLESVTVFNDKIYATQSRSGEILVFNAENYEELKSTSIFKHYPKSLSFDPVDNKVYATDGVSNTVYVHNVTDTTLPLEDEISVYCGATGVPTDGLEAAVYIRPYLYIHIAESSFIIRVNMLSKKCDNKFLVDLSTHNSASQDFNDRVKFTEKSFDFSAIMADTSVGNFTGSGTPTIYLTGKNWGNIYKISNASALPVLKVLSIFAVAMMALLY